MQQWPGHRSILFQFAGAEETIETPRRSLGHQRHGHYGLQKAEEAEFGSTQMVASARHDRAQWKGFGQRNHHSSTYVLSPCFLKDFLSSLFCAWRPSAIVADASGWTSASVSVCQTSELFNRCRMCKSSQLSAEPQGLVSSVIYSL